MKTAGLFLRRMMRNDQGAIAVWFALSLLVIAPLVVGAMNFYLLANQRSRLQDAADAAALYAARSESTTATALQAAGEAALNANLSARDRGLVTSKTFVTVTSGTSTKVVATVVMSPDGLTNSLWTNSPMTVTTEVMKSSYNLEVSLVLDITGSMSGSRISNLKVAAKNLVDTVVKDVQTPYYSKLALVPYAAAVNVGSYATDIRGETNRVLTGASRTNPVAVTYSGPSLNADENVRIFGAGGMTQLNYSSSNSATDYKVTGPSGSTFTLRRFSNNAAINGTSYGTYTSGGSIECYRYGCNNLRYSTSTTYPVTNCAAERTDANRYTDASPSGAPLQMVYQSSNCPATQIIPLTTNRTALKTAIDGLVASGGTAGHLGLAWGWYMVSPNFSYLWPSASQPAAYGTNELMKVVVMMTDGEFNTSYCGGLPGYGGCSPVSSTTQAVALCTEIKKKNIILYTVGFSVSSASKTMLTNCATSPSYAFFPATGADLVDAFKAIAQDINRLRLAR